MRATIFPTFPLARARIMAGAAALAVLATSGPAEAARRSRQATPPAPVADARCITEQEVVEAQRAWGDGIVAIGRVHAAGGDTVAAAAAHINRFYGYDQSLVLFKPTLASVDQFRITFDSALSYFVGQNPSFPEDRGFALRPWTKVRWANSGIVNNSCNMAVAMGNYWFTPADGGAETKVEYTLGYVRGADGALRIVVHHSSVPFNPN